MLYTERWGRKRFPLLMMLAQAVAISVDLLYDMLVAVRDRRFEKLAAGVEDLTRLNALYSDPDSAFWVAGAALHAREFSADKLTEMRLLAPNVGGMISSEMEKVIQSSKAKIAARIKKGKLEKFEPENDPLYRNHIAWVRNMIANRNEEIGHMDRLIRLPEVVFFVRVILPCWLEYGQTVRELLDLAKCGDLSAMKKLLCLDSRFLEVPALREQFRLHLNELPPVGQKSLVKALTEEPEANLTKQRIRTIGAALILNFSKRFTKFIDACAITIMENTIIPHISRKQIPKAHRKFKRIIGKERHAFDLKTTDIRELFDAVEKDRTKRRNARDPWIAENDHAFYMAIRREAGFWQSLAPVSLK